jgi:hypothetical protein
MSRSLRRLRDWPECPNRLTLDELRSERSEWQRRLGLPCHPSSRKVYAKRVRDVEKEMDRRESESESA